MRQSAVLLLFVPLLACGHGGDFLADNGVCEGYADPASSPYKAPWPAGATHTVIQGNCGGLTHVGPYRFSYDILMPIHSPILAARAGTVINVVQSNKDGNGCPHANEIWVVHDDGTVGTYLHLTQNGALVALGDAVTQGQQIGWSGLTGCTTTPHLHFEVKSREGDYDNAIVGSVPVTFSNVPSAPIGLQQGQDYTPE